MAGYELDPEAIAGAGAPPGPTGYDLDPESLFPLGASAPTAKPPPSLAGEWGAGLHFLDAMLMGYGPQLAAMGPQAAGMEATAAGAAPGAAPSPEEQTKAAQRWEAARAAWAQEHPTAALGAELAGTAVPMIGALAGQEYMLGPLAARLSMMGPRFAQLVNVLRGTAGAERTGVTGAAARAGSQAVRGAVEGAESVAGEKAIKDEPVTFEDIAKGAAIGGTFNPLLRGFMPRARQMGPAEAMLRSAEGAPMHHRGLGAEAAHTVASVLRHPAGSVGTLGGTLFAVEHPQLALSALQHIPGGELALGGITGASALGTAAERVMRQPWYQERILRGAMGQSTYPFSRVNPLTPLATAPVTVPPEQLEGLWP